MVVGMAALSYLSLPFLCMYVCECVHVCAGTLDAVCIAPAVLEVEGEVDVREMGGAVGREGETSVVRFFSLFFSCLFPPRLCYTAALGRRTDDACSDGWCTSSPPPPSIYFL